MKVFKNPNNDSPLIAYIVSETDVDLDVLGEEYSHFVECDDEVSENDKHYSFSTFCFYLPIEEN